jgi:hypothetical protein
MHGASASNLQLPVGCVVCNRVYEVETAMTMWRDGIFYSAEESPCNILPLLLQRNWCD